MLDLFAKLSHRTISLIVIRQAVARSFIHRKKRRDYEPTIVANDDSICLRFYSQHDILRKKSITHRAYNAILLATERADGFDVNGRVRFIHDA